MKHLRRSRLCTAGLILWAALGCASRPAEPPPVAVERQEWTAPTGSTGVQILTDHFDLRVTTDDAVLVDVLAPFMETTFAEYRRLVPPATDADERLVVYVFRDRREWAAYVQAAFPAQAHTYLHIQSGGFADYATATSVAYDLGRDHTLSLLAHEGMHQYFARYLPKHVPAWINEGMACQWEAFDLDGDRPVFTPERNFLRRNNLREAITEEDGFIPLSELLTMNAGEAVTQKIKQPSRIYYAQVWSTVLFLRRGGDGKYADAFAKLLRDVGTDRLDAAISAYRAATAGSESLSAGEVAFRQYISDDLDAFMADYREYARMLLD